MEEMDFTGILRNLWYIILLIGTLMAAFYYGYIDRKVKGEVKSTKKDMYSSLDAMEKRMDAKDGQREKLYNERYYTKISAAKLEANSANFGKVLDEVRRDVKELLRIRSKGSK